MSCLFLRAGCKRIASVVLARHLVWTCDMQGLSWTICKYPSQGQGTKGSSQVSLKILRKQDAVVAMMAGKHNASNVDLIKQWDVKMRNQLLQALPSFRTCPKCGGGGGDN
eukprot:CAMPEP_0116121756 /NCGR_PEP_ID=MMETSP0329-20121206/3863_1 /TAXON_ID=697910 /ORGANISM="Pseudo-nitzschia arenysensis, Strain B593" /LENGTH=109 /DNA_ID=CAMNT_0003615583 /DNA_START=294 /DNA_END=620 /DNA_ORIENTATION=-